ncbi:MAG: hypothetical protein M3297_16750 [Thermoproteota archaeon]|nr:hypothetical protein [Thermoproteota archaeon]
MKSKGRNMKNIKQNLEAKDLTVKEHHEGKPSSEKFNKAKIKLQDASRDLQEGF